MTRDRMHAGMMAEFRTAEEMLEAISRLRAVGYRELESYSPFHVPEAGQRLALPRSRLPWLVLVAGLVGAGVSYWIMWYTNAVSYPLNVGDRPLNAVPAFVPITFEGMVLLAATTAFIGFLAALGLPKLWHPVFEAEGFERATIDRFWVGVDARDPRFDRERTTRDLEGLHPLRVVPVGSGR